MDRKYFPAQARAGRNAQLLRLADDICGGFVA
jgi:hypothetical protein